MFFYLTTIALDITFGTVFWVVKSTKNGICYLVWGNENPKLIKYRDDDTLKKLEEKTKFQEKEIQLLKMNLEELKKKFINNTN